MMYVLAVTPKFHGYGHVAIEHYHLQSTAVIVSGPYGDLVKDEFVPAGPGIEEYQKAISGDEWTVFQERTNARGRPLTKAESEFEHADIKDFLENGPAVLIRVTEIQDARRAEAEAEEAEAEAERVAKAEAEAAAVEAEKVELLATREAEREAAAEAARVATEEAESEEGAAAVP